MNRNRNGQMRVAMEKLKSSLLKRHKKFDAKYLNQIHKAELSKSIIQLEKSLLDQSVLKVKNRELARTLATYKLQCQAYESEVARFNRALHMAEVENLSLKNLLERQKQVTSYKISDVLKGTAQHLLLGSTALSEAFQLLMEIKPPETATTEATADATDPSNPPLDSGENIADTAGSPIMPSTSRTSQEKSDWANHLLGSHHFRTTVFDDLELDRLSIIMETSHADISSRTSIASRGECRQADLVNPASSNFSTVPPEVGRAEPVPESEPEPQPDLEPEPETEPEPELSMAAPGNRNSNNDSGTSILSPDKRRNMYVASNSHYSEKSAPSPVIQNRRFTYVVSDSQQNESLPSPMLRNRTRLRRTSMIFRPPSVADLCVPEDECTSARTNDASSSPQIDINLMNVSDASMELSNMSFRLTDVAVISEPEQPCVPILSATVAEKDGARNSESKEALFASVESSATELRNGSSVVKSKVKQLRKLSLTLNRHPPPETLAAESIPSTSRDAIVKKKDKTKLRDHRRSRHESTDFGVSDLDHQNAAIQPAPRWKELNDFHVSKRQTKPSVDYPDLMVNKKIKRIKKTSPKVKKLKKVLTKSKQSPVVPTRADVRRVSEVLRNGDIFSPELTSNSSPGSPIVIKRSRRSTAIPSKFNYNEESISITPDIDVILSPPPPKEAFATEAKRPKRTAASKEISYKLKNINIKLRRDF